MSLGIQSSGNILQDTMRWPINYLPKILIISVSNTNKVFIQVLSQ